MPRHPKHLRGSREHIAEMALLDALNALQIASDALADTSAHATRTMIVTARAMVCSSLKDLTGSKTGVAPPVGSVVKTLNGVPLPNRGAL